jgi:hypothetical protein
MTRGFWRFLRQNTVALLPLWPRAANYEPRPIHSSPPS